MVNAKPAWEVNSGSTGTVRVYSDKLEGWLGSVCVLELRRGQPDATTGRGKVVDYPVVTVTLPDLASYDQLLEAA